MRRKSVVGTQVFETEILKPKVKLSNGISKTTFIRTLSLSLFLLSMYIILNEEEVDNNDNTDDGEIKELRKVLLLSKEWSGLLDKYPKRRNILLYSTWRSGSSFIGGLLVEHYIPQFLNKTKQKQYDILVMGINTDQPEFNSTNTTITITHLRIVVFY